MNSNEFGSKILIVYSLIKNERVDLSCLPDEIFDEVINRLSQTTMCQSGSAFDGKYVMEKTKASPFVNWLEENIVPRYQPVKKLIAIFNRLAESDEFRIVSEDAPTINKQLAVQKMKGHISSQEEMEIHNRYMLTWGMISTTYRHHAFGYDGLKTVIGEGNKEKRVCRFCRRTYPDTSFNSLAHAISKGLGNELLICNEECDDCNKKLSKTEDNLMHYLDIRRAMGGVLTRKSGLVPSVDGKGFVIRGDDNNQAVLYIEREALPNDFDTTRTFYIQLETLETITHQGIYKSLCKIVIDLLPTIEMAHFDQTVGWINGSVLDSELPSYLAAYNREKVLQPTVDIFLSQKPGIEPYCTAVLHVLDVIFLFILPEVDVDKAQFKSFASIQGHLGKFAALYGGEWHEEDSSEYTLSNPWAIWTVRPDDPQVQIRSKSDTVFMRFNRKESERDESVFPTFCRDGISEPVISNVNFVQHSFASLSNEDLQQVSVNYERMVCRLDKTKSSAVLSLAFNFSDSSNRLSYFDFSFEATVHLSHFDMYIEMGEWFCIDYHLRDYLFSMVLAAADIELKRFTAGTVLEPINLKHTQDERVIRQLYYQIPVDGNRCLFVKDAQIHNL